LNAAQYNKNQTLRRPFDLWTPYIVQKFQHTAYYRVRNTLCQQRLSAAYPILMRRYLERFPDRKLAIGDWQL
jgi:hypothetical protein